MDNFCSSQFLECVGKDDPRRLSNFSSYSIEEYNSNIKSVSNLIIVSNIIMSLGLVFSFIIMVCRWGKYTETKCCGSKCVRQDV